MTINGTFHTLSVTDMGSALTFWIDAMGCTERFRKPAFSEVLAGESVICLKRSDSGGGRTSLGIDVSDLDTLCAAVTAGGGAVLRLPIDLAPGVRIATLEDTDGNRFHATEHVPQSQ